jgi:hypothetical protein
MKEPTKIGATSVETENGLQTLELVQGLVSRREREREMNCERGVEAVDELLRQLDETTAYSVCVSEEIDEEVQER